MLGELFSSRARVEILKLFLFNPNDSFYQRQISLLTHQPIRGVQREVEKLEKLGLLERSAQGNRVYYKANQNCPIFAELKNIIYKSAGIAECLREHLKESDSIKIAFIYGSYAKGEENISSDIDFMVIGNVSARELSKLLSKPKAELGREINYAIFDAKEFRRRLSEKDHFLTTVLSEDKIFIIGDDNGLKSIIKSR